MHLSVLHQLFNFSQHQSVDLDTVFTSINQELKQYIATLWVGLITR